MMSQLDVIEYETGSMILLWVYVPDWLAHLAHIYVMRRAVRRYRRYRRYMRWVRMREDSDDFYLCIPCKIDDDQVVVPSFEIPAKPQITRSEMAVEDILDAEEIQ